MVRPPGVFGHQFHEGFYVPPERSHTYRGQSDSPDWGPSWSWVGIPDEFPHMLCPDFVIPQGPPGSQVRCNKQKSLHHASMGPSHQRRQHGGRERISPSPGVLRARDNSALRGGVGSSSLPRPALSFPPCLMCLVKSLTQPTSFQHKQQIQLSRPLVPQFPSVLSSLKSSSPPAGISSPPGL